MSIVYRGLIVSECACGTDPVILEKDCVNQWEGITCPFCERTVFGKMTSGVNSFVHYDDEVMETVQTWNSWNPDFQRWGSWDYRLSYRKRRMDLILKALCVATIVVFAAAIIFNNME